MTASLPSDVRAVFDRFVTTELTTIDRRGQPITWPVTPYYSDGAPCIDVSTGLGYPKKANDARANPLVALLFSDHTGSGMPNPPIVLVQGSAEVDDHDLEANRRRYDRESAQKLPAIAELVPVDALKRWAWWYYTRIYIHVRPERIYVWPGDEPYAPPQIFGAHMEEVRSGHSEEPARVRARPDGGVSRWDARLRQLGSRYSTAVLSIVSPDGFPFAMRTPVAIDAANRWIRIAVEHDDAPLAPGLACLTAHAHSEQFTWQRNFQVRGDLQRIEGEWVLIPHRVVGGFELPRSRIEAVRDNATKAWRFRRTAKRELARRRLSSSNGDAKGRHRSSPGQPPP